MLHKTHNNRDVRRKVSPPGPTFMTESQMSDYLANLRQNRPARPAGSRPLPTKSISTPVASTQSSISNANLSEEQPITNVSVTALPQRDDDASHSPQESLHRRAHSEMRFGSIGSRKSIGRPLVQDPPPQSYSIRGRKVSPTAVVQPLVDTGSQSQYRESGTRWLERQEALSLRDALQEMDLRDEETRIHDAAKDEAADLVWKHQNPRSLEEEKAAAYRNPDLPRNPFKQHLQKGAHARSQSLTYGELAKRIPRSTSERSVSDTSASSTERQSTEVNSTRNTDKKEADAATVEDRAGVEEVSPEASKESRDISATPLRHVSGTPRNASSGSTKGLFRNPDDEIYEDAQGPPIKTNSPHVRFQTNSPLQATQRNPQLRGSRPLPTPSENVRKRFNPFEIHQNPPTKSRDAAYTQNESSKPAPPVEVKVENSNTKDGLEIRSDEIRAATSMRLKDRSPKLPIPTAVSDRPGRPIVSFDPAWQPSKLPAKDSPPSSRDSSTPSNFRTVPNVTVSNVITPTISLPDEESGPAVPSIVLPGEGNPADKRGPAIPSISLPSDDVPSKVPSINVSGKSAVPAKPIATSSRPLPDPATISKESKKTRLPWLDRGPPSIARGGVPTATCDTCSLPIAGRVVTAMGSKNQSSQRARFHPECFNCFHCGTSLEAAEFYPEPDDKRTARLEREDLRDGDEGTALRFYCHLDFHEFFSPRCKNCKTPIEGEVIVAAGSEWHVGHFFCAECGDPFNSTTPFVEKDGYAWCVACHTRRTSPRCRACKKPILDEVTITALGGQWHPDCFVCLECSGGFGDEGRFFIREIEIPLTEKERRRGLKPRMEERAVCRGCEERRLKA